MPDLVMQLELGLGEATPRRTFARDEARGGEKLPCRAAPRAASALRGGKRRRTVFSSFHTGPGTAPIS